MTDSGVRNHKTGLLQFRPLQRATETGPRLQRPNTQEPLQQVQNAPARLVFGLRSRDPVRPSLIELHCLPVRWRIHFKLCILKYAVHNGRCPVYMNNLMQAVSSRGTRDGLNSASSLDYVITRLRMKVGQRAFSHVGPAAETDQQRFKNFLKRTCSNKHITVIAYTRFFFSVIGTISNALMYCNMFKAGLFESPVGLTYCTPVFQPALQS
jgi:hypothetical protein